MVLEYWAGYSLNPLWLSVVGWRTAPRDLVIHGMAHGPLLGEGGGGANRDQDTAGILASDPLQYMYLLLSYQTLKNKIVLETVFFFFLLHILHHVSKSEIEVLLFYSFVFSFCPLVLPW